MDRFRPMGASWFVGCVLGPMLEDCAEPSGGSLWLTMADWQSPLAACRMQQARVTVIHGKRASDRCSCSA